MGSLVLTDLYDRLVALGLKSEESVHDEADAESTKSANESEARSTGISGKRLEAVFSKELRSRERAAGKHEVSSQALACQHTWDNTGAGGMHCQICNFETKD